MAEAIRLDPAVDAAKRTIATLHTSKLPRELNDDIITMAIVILRLAGHQIADLTGEDHVNTTKEVKTP